MMFYKQDIKFLIFQIKSELKKILTHFHFVGSN
ncbi:hypothetical protein MHA_0629 [Mannheimia haemolytica PHL213]|nr:hypothetical protein MHA_0629 [Mannheimia haemolytica PHL213]